MKEYTRHELSELFPDMSDEAYQELKADIQAKRQFEPIIVVGSEVLDGWHRYRAVKELTEAGDYNLDLLVNEYDPQYDGDDMRAFVISRNSHRRHLTTRDRVRAAAKKLKYRPGRKGTARDAVTLDHVAEVAGVSRRTAALYMKEPEAEPQEMKSSAKSRTEQIKELEKKLATARGKVIQLENQLKSLKVRSTIKRG